MTIRIRLALSFLAMILLVAFVGGFFLYSGEIRARYFNEAILSTKISSIAKEMNYFLDQQLKAFDYYVLFSETSKKEDYNDYKKTIKSKFFEWKNLVGNDAVSNSEIVNLEEDYSSVIESADNIISLKRKGLRSKALDVVDKKYTPREKHLREQIRGIMNSKDLLAELSREKASNLAKQQLVISIVVIGISIIIGLVLSLYIFRFIANPLYQLQKGAEEIGSGNFDFHLELENSKDEFGKLAMSFNEMAENIRKMQSQIIQMDRMSAMGQLAGGVAHELNNPLTGVLGQSQILLSKLEKDNPYRGHVEKIERAAIRCRKIVRELLDFSRQKEYNFTSTNIHELIDSTLLLCESDLAAIQISVEKKFSSKVTLAPVSPPHLQQVFLNLINNALHAMSPGGKLTIMTVMYPSGYIMRDRRKNNQDITVPGKWIEIIFRDTGSGISDKNLQHIFDPFFTTKEVGKGTGLGLTISYGIIQNHKGLITAESEGHGHGSTFSIRLPFERKK